MAERSLRVGGRRAEDSAVDLAHFAVAMIPFLPPPGYARIKTVGSFHELVATPFAGGVNALCWPRVLAGDFGEVVELLGAGEGIITLDDSRLHGLPVSAAGRSSISSVFAVRRNTGKPRTKSSRSAAIHSSPRENLLDHRFRDEQIIFVLLKIPPVLRRLLVRGDPRQRPAPRREVARDGRVNEEARRAHRPAGCPASIAGSTRARSWAKLSSKGQTCASQFWELSRKTARFTD